MSNESPILSTLNLLLKHPVTLDVETTITNKGNPHTVVNKLVLVQSKVAAEEPKLFFEEDFKYSLLDAQRASIIVGFNLKFDLAWLFKQFGYTATCVWDCQLAEFILEQQRNPYPSLENTCIKYGLGHKQDKVKQYWDEGIDTDQIPREILAEYGAQDVNLTYQVMLKQVEQFKEKPQLFRLFRLHCNDLLVLLEMENNGILYDVDASIAATLALEERIKSIEGKVREFTNGVPINFSSRDDMSSFLYGGTIHTETRVPCGIYKSGAKVGETRYKILRNSYQMPRLVEPPKGSELKKEGYYSTEEATLLVAKTNKTGKFIISNLLERSKLEKLRGTYLAGLPKLIDKMMWPNHTLYSNLNQCVATTGRLSSTKPNQQNLPPEAKTFCVSRY